LRTPLYEVGVSPDQCREGHERLNWTRRELSEATDVPLWFIAAFEDGRDTAAFLAGYLVDMRRSLEAFGIGFQFELEAGQYRPARVTYSPPESGEGSPSPDDLLRQLEAMQKRPDL
jgi:hypothetical protein